MNKYQLSHIKNNTLSYENRIILYNVLHDKLKNSDDCKDNLPYDLLNTGGYSSNWEKNIVLNNQTFHYALKVQTVNPFVIKYDVKFNVWREYDILKQCTNLVLEGVTCNLPMLYDLKVCDNNKIIFYNELANGSFTDFIYRPHSVDEWDSCYFQIWIGMYTLQKHLHLVHNDLRFGNILFHKVPDVNIKYVIDGNSYYIPTFGYNFIIWDFGGSKIADNDYIAERKLAFNIDLHFFHDAYNRLRVLMLMNKYTEKELRQFFTSPEAKLYITKAQEECERRFRATCRYDEKFKISLVYYLIEHGKFDMMYKSKKENLTLDNVVQMPPPETMAFLKDLSEHNYAYGDVIGFKPDIKRQIPPIPNLLEKYFSKYKNEIPFAYEFQV